MKILVNIVRILVGLLFIFSGLVKANDPIGLSYKMQEFFMVWGMSALDGITLILSIFMIAFEIIAGAALIIGWRINLVSWLLLLLIIFFTFLTGYAYLSGKFKDCGCFGDCLPITSKQSFIKDLILLILILFIFFNRRYVKPILSKSELTIAMLLICIFSFASQWYTLKYLPVTDCLPFKVGKNISQQMQMPADAIPDSTVITFEYEKGGKKIEFTGDNFPDDFNDSTYKFLNRYDKLIRPGKNNEPPIKVFVLSKEDGTDITSDILNLPQVLLLFMEDASRPLEQWGSGFEKIYSNAVQKNVPVYIVTSTMPSVKAEIAKSAFEAMNLLNGDNTMIRMAARTNPTLYQLKNGTIVGKWSYKNLGKIEF